MNSDQSNSLETMRERLIHFPNTQRFRELELEFWKKPSVVGEKVTPLWDLNRSSLWWNWELSIDDASEISLVEDNGKFGIGARLFRPDAYRFPGNWRALDKDKALLVIDCWLNGIPLTPPVLVPREDGTLGKVDGFHRLVLALMCRPHTVPFWLLAPKPEDSD